MKKRPIVKYEVSCDSCLDTMGDASRELVEGRRGIAEYKKKHDLGPVHATKVKSSAKKS